MQPTTGDVGLEAAIARAVGHPAPFTDEERAAITELDVVGAVGPAGLEGIEGCSGLRRLSLLGSALDGLGFVGRLPRLASLSVRCSALSDLGGLAGAAELTDLELNFTSAQDLAPLLQMPALRRVHLLGNPLSEESFESVLPSIARTPAPRWGRPPACEAQRREEWEITRRLWDRGISLCFGRLDGVLPLLVKPGPGAGQQVDHVEISEGIARRHLNLTEAESVDADAFLGRFKPALERARAAPPPDFRSQRTPGDSIDAAAWISGSALPEEEQAALLRFVGRFPSLTFYREGPRALERIGRQEGVTLPPWLTALRQVLCFAAPDRRLQVRFDAYDRNASPRADGVGEMWYQLALSGYGEPGRKELLLGRCDVFLIGVWTDGAGLSQLGVRIADPEDRTIYEFAELDLQDSVSEGRPPERSIYPAFSSYASMLGHITAIKFEDSGEVIHG